MKDIAILSLFYNNYNFGGQLQAYALQSFLSKNGFSSEQVRYDVYRKGALYNYLRSIKHAKWREYPALTFYFVKYVFVCIRLIGEYIKFLKRKSVFRKSFTQVESSKLIYNRKTLENIADEYNRFLVGSDIVWYFGNYAEGFTFSFINGAKKISYAASLGSMSVPEGWAEQYLDGIKKLDAIAVREKSIAEELQKLIPDKEIFVTADPTLLFTSEEWNACIPQKRISEKYALLYILSEDKKQCLAAEKWAHSMGLKAYVFPHIQNHINYWQKDYGDIRDFSSGPLEFVSLIKNAEVIITDSFHAVIFSTVFHRPFFALQRDSEKEFVGRVENFLDGVGLYSQIISTEQLCEKTSLPVIDFSYSDKIIERDREFSIKYLKDNLE